MRRDTKGLILDAAIKVIARDGLASVNAIIQEAGLSKSVFFHHFHSKQELLLKLAERDFNDKLERIKNCAKTLPDAPGRMLKAYVLVWVDDVTLTGKEQLNSLSALNEPLLRTRLAEQVRHLFDMLWDPGIPDVAMRIIVNACIGGWAQNLVSSETREEIIQSRKVLAEGMMHIIDSAARSIDQYNH